ncbi:MAG: Gmad2 immunoglobulin-like domain-containing protein [Candidatus Promineifilaceae bacterium]
MKRKSYVSGIVLALALAALGVIMTACVRPAAKNATADPELEETAAFSPTDQATTIPEPTDTSEPTDVPVLPTVVVEEAPTQAPTVEPTEPPESVPEEEPASISTSIAITFPLDGMLLDTTHTIVIGGTGEGLPEGNLVVQVEDEEGNILIATATMLAGEDVGLGGPGTWEVSFLITLDQGQEGSLKAFATSPADGSILAEDTVTVSFFQSAAEPFIEISNPVSGTIILEDSITVSGRGGGLFEGNVVVQAEDIDGNVLLTQPTILRGDNVGMGGSGAWETTISLTTFPGTLGRIVAFSTSPADGNIIASDSVDVAFGETAGALIHVVQLGETLYRISLIYGVPMAAIMEANGLLNADYIYAGQELIIPPATP